MLLLTFCIISWTRLQALWGHGLSLTTPVPRQGCLTHRKSLIGAVSCRCGWQRPAGGSTPSHPVYQLGARLGLSRHLINPGAYYQNIKLNESLPTSRLHVGGPRLLLYAPAWAHIRHQSYQLGRDTISPLSLLAFSIALKWRCISVPQCSSALWGGIVKTPVCSWSTSHPPNIVPPRDFKGQSLTQRLWLPYPIFECPSFFTSHLIVQLEKHLFGSSLLSSHPRETLNLVCFSQCLVS